MSKDIMFSSSPKSSPRNSILSKPIMTPLPKPIIIPPSKSIITPLSKPIISLGPKPISPSATISKKTVKKPVEKKPLIKEEVIDQRPRVPMQVTGMSPKMPGLPELKPLIPTLNMINLNPLAPTIQQIIIPETSKIPMIPPKLNGVKKRVTKVSWLAVYHNVAEGPAIGDDRIAPLKCTWHDNLVRIANIGDGSCFIHAVLKAFYKSYQNNNDAQFRLDMAQQVRRDLGILLGSNNPEYRGHTYWETTGRGQFSSLLMQEIVDENMINGPDPFLDYSLYGLQRFLNSHSWIGDESYNFISDAFNLDIFVMRINSVDVITHLHTKVPNKIRNAIVIVSNDSHYETLALKTPEGLKTVFPPGDPFVEILTNRFIGEGNFYDPQNLIPYDPDIFFVKRIVEIFTNLDILHFEIPEIVYNRFNEHDPFIVCINRLKNEINQESIRYMNILMTRPLNQLQALLIRLEHENVFPKDEIQRIKQLLKPVFLKNETIPDMEQLTTQQLINEVMKEGLIGEDVGGILLDNIYDLSKEHPL